MPRIESDQGPEFPLVITPDNPDELLNLPSILLEVERFITLSQNFDYTNLGVP